MLYVTFGLWGLFVLLHKLHAYRVRRALWLAGQPPRRPRFTLRLEAFNEASEPAPRLRTTPAAS